MKSFRPLPLVVTTAVALGLAGCASPSSAGPAPADDGDTRPVTLMLNWYPYGEHAPFYYGLEKGVFAKHGIDLKIEAGQGSTKTIQAVGAGQVDFGWADTAALLPNVDKGVDVKSVGVFLQTTPSAVQVFADSGIETPEDLKGKTIAVSAGDAPTTTFPFYLEAIGLSPNDVKQQNLDAAGKISAMLTGKVDGLIGFMHDQGPTVAAKSGREVRYFPYADAGLSYFSNGLLATSSTIKDDPDLVRDMVAATSEAFAAAVDDPAGAVDAMAGKDPQMPAKDVLAEQWKQTITVLHTEATKDKPFGYNDPADWLNTLDVLHKAGLISGDKGVEDYFDGAFAPGD
ncbi:ABC transporter substrate-binding protein [Xylanimonas ulmi]|uniref:NitT/TauT family transport system substrate-binding protein n=1 Tax=Xylanimonas ulmi TaxID=228973 RepID=A0A4Q7M3M1_9MICO|nr:ABC transporter substrate-binding protein [Xylanibacterium ulmi]RZS61931.1 NitT/TauT family transport system substrate-binding protein [Xylanibacterium ulmi]